MPTELEKENCPECGPDMEGSLDPDELCDMHASRVRVSMVMSGDELTVNGFGPYNVVNVIAEGSRTPIFTCVHADIDESGITDIPLAEKYAFPFDGTEPEIEPQRLFVFLVPPENGQLDPNNVPPATMKAMDERGEVVGDRRVITDVEVRK